MRHCKTRVKSKGEKNIGQNRRGLFENNFARDDNDDDSIGGETSAPSRDVLLQCCVILSIKIAARPPTCQSIRNLRTLRNPTLPLHPRFINPNSNNNPVLPASPLQ